MRDMPSLTITPAGAPVAALVAQVCRLRPLKPAQFTVASERWMSAFASFLLAAACLAMLLLGLMALQHAYRPLSSAGQTSAGIVGAAASGLAVLALFVQAVGGSIALVAQQLGHHRVLVSECLHDFAQVHELTRHSLPVLRDAARWIAQWRLREQSRLGRLAGGGDKLALFAIVAAGWQVSQAVLPLPEGPLQTAVILGAAFLSGLALGAMWRQRQIARLAYPIALLQLAIAQVQPDVGASAGDPPS